MIDSEEAEIFLRGIVSLKNKASSYKWWDMIKHRYPDYQWNGENIVLKRNVTRKIQRANSL